MRRLAALVVAALVLASCAGDDDGSTTPSVTFDDSTDLSRYVLAAESIASIPGFEEAMPQPLDDVELFENPDPRGPCGGESSAPPMEGTAGRSFVAPAATVLQVVARGPEVDAFVDEQLADIVEPCGPYESMTNVGTTQEVDQIDLAPLADDGGYVSTSRIQDDGQTAYVGSAVVRVEGTTSLIFAISVEPIAFSSMESLARLVDAQLRVG